MKNAQRQLKNQIRSLEKNDSLISKRKAQCEIQYNTTIQIFCEYNVECDCKCTKSYRECFGNSFIYIFFAFPQNSQLRTFAIFTIFIQYLAVTQYGKTFKSFRVI